MSLKYKTKTAWEKKHTAAAVFVSTLVAVSAPATVAGFSNTTYRKTISM